MSHILACLTLIVFLPLCLSLSSSPLSPRPRSVFGPQFAGRCSKLKTLPPPSKMRVAYAPPRYENRRLSRDFPSRAAVKIPADLPVDRLDAIAPNKVTDGPVIEQPPSVSLPVARNLRPDCPIRASVACA